METRLKLIRKDLLTNNQLNPGYYSGQINFCVSYYILFELDGRLVRK